MFRTRDFLLVFTTVAFLVLSIGATLLKQYVAPATTTPSVQLATVTDREYDAEVLLPETISREERLAEMRRKIAAGNGFTVSAAPIPELESTLETEPAAPTSTTASTTMGTIVVFECPSYQVYGGAWPRSGVSLMVSEGNRVIYQEMEASLLPPSSATSSTQVTLQPNTLLQLPIKLTPALAPSCLPSDVVGVAQDGSLIRNVEAGLYGVFGENTLIGYALDGFPIYGVSSVPTDACGGTTIAGQYRYYLSDEREMIINCFAAPPVAL
ncbi:hypothetical protein KC906_03810 [Candidatus Kaiserbacteria bacterium]|nr:hypothetical protein [Candidatus Kaiserbacteria bacterium]